MKGGVFAFETWWHDSLDHDLVWRWEVDGGRFGWGLGIC